MKIVNILVNSRMRKKQKDIIKHGKYPEDYKIALELYEKEIREKIPKDLKEGFVSTIFITSLVIFLLHLIFAGIISFKLILASLIMIFLFSLMLIIPLAIILSILERTSNFVKCLFSARYLDNKYKNADINNYHNWTKVGEHTVYYAWSDKLDIPCLVEEFKCSVCGKKAEMEHEL